MEEPISLKIRRFKNAAVNLINTSGLPLIVVEPVLKDILSVVQTKLEQEYLQDKENYKRFLEEQMKADTEKIRKEGEIQNDQ